MYNKIERNKIYRKALRLLNGESNVVDKFTDTHWAQLKSGVCELLYISSMDEWNNMYHPANDFDEWLKHFPEFYKHKPDEYPLFWWPKMNREIRKQVLAKCIELTD